MSKNLGRKAVTVLAVSAVAGGALLVGGVASAATATDIPTVTGVGPLAANTAGGTWVNIAGKGFNDDAVVAAKVLVGGTAVTELIKVSDSRLVAKVPVKGPGIYRVSVENSQGVSLDGAKDQFGYIASPVITGLVDSTGAEVTTGLTASAAGGGLVTVSGTNLQHAIHVTVDGLPAPIIKRTRTATRDRLTVKLPAHAPSATGVNLLVTTPAGTTAEPTTATANNVVFTPVIKTLSTKTAAAAGGAAVVVRGTGFSTLLASAPLQLNNTNVTQAAVLSDTEMVVVLPATSAGDATLDLVYAAPGTDGVIGTSDDQAGTEVTSPLTLKVV